MAERGAERRARHALEEGGLYELARMLTQDGDAEDLVQEAVTLGLEQHEPPRAWLPWLRQVLRNLVRARARRRAVRDARRLLLVVDDGQEEPPESSLDRAQMLEAIRHAMDELDEPYRSAVHGRFFEELTPLEIARRDGDPPATVRWRVHEGLRRTRAHLDRRFGGRDRWCGAFAVGLTLPLPQSTSAATGAGGTGSKAALLAMLGAAATTVAILVQPVLEDEPGEPDERAEISASAAHPVAAATGKTDADAFESGGHSELSVEGSAVVEDDRDAGDAARAALLEALQACLADLPLQEGPALGRLELEVHTWTLENGNAIVERVDLTTGRKLMGIDDVDATTPPDAPGVLVHDELATCVAYSLDTDRLPVWYDGWSKGIATHAHTHPFRLVVELDARGNVVEAASSGCPSPQARPLVPVELEDAAVPDPDEAAAILGLPIRGPTHPAAARIVICGAYCCPFCKRSERLLRELGARQLALSITWLHFPLDQDAADLARAAVAAHRQQRFWDMHDALFENAKPIDGEELLALAQQLGLDVDRFAADLADPETDRVVARQRRVCERAGARGTPSFFVNGDFVPGTRGVEELAEIIEATQEPSG